MIDSNLERNVYIQERKLDFNFKEKSNVMTMEMKMQGTIICPSKHTNSNP